MKNCKTHILVTGFCSFLILGNQVSGQDNIATCASIDNAEDRLACYDRASESVRDLPVVRLPRSTRTEPQPQVGNNAAEPARVRQDDFGLELKQERQQQAGPGTRTYVVAAARHNDFTGWTIEFEGGSTWKQVGTDDYNIKVGETYTVSRASFNSFMLSDGKVNKKIRITRVQ